MAKHYVCVFKANPARRDVLIDIGGDPDFTAPIPTWGICRPNVRSYVKKGSLLFFIGNYIGTSEYYMKGFFQVGEKISYKEALDRFPNRRNVIVRKSNSILLNNNKWQDNNRKRKIQSLYGKCSPDIFTKISCRGTTFVQNPLDDHPIDNWKCRRVFCCKKAQIEDCINNNTCYKDKEFYSAKRYIVSSDLWQDIGSFMVSWDKVCPKSKLNRPLKIYVKGKPMHPPMLLDDKEANELLRNIHNYLNN